MLDLSNTIIMYFFYFLVSNAMRIYNPFFIIQISDSDQKVTLNSNAPTSTKFELMETMIKIFELVYLSLKIYKIYRLAKIHGMKYVTRV